MSIIEMIKKTLTSKLSTKCSELEIDNLLNSLKGIVSSYFQLINNENEFEWVLIEDICYIDRERNNAIFYTLNKQYTQAFTFEMVKKITAEHAFEISDQKILVNMNNVVMYDEEAGKIYFDKDNLKIFTFVSSRNMPKFKKLGKEKEINHVLREITTKKSKNLDINSKLFSLFN